MTINETTATTSVTVPTVTGIRAVRLLMQLAGPSVVAGAIARRHSTLPLLEKVQADASTPRLVSGLREEFGSGPLLLDLPGRRVVVLLDREDASRVLEETPDPFSPANREKVAALSSFQPHGVLVTRGRLRVARRAFNESVLETGEPLHYLAGAMTETVVSETGELNELARARGHLDAGSFLPAWWNLVRSLVLGSSARQDNSVTDQLWSLRSQGNWSYFLPHRRRLRDRFIESLYQYAARAEMPSLIAAVNQTSAAPSVDPIGQVPHWLFAFDAAGIVTIRALALLATHPRQRARALEEIDETDPRHPSLYPFLRACVLESARLWPTTPVILRDSIAPTTWPTERGVAEIPTDSAFIILTAAFHRDPQNVPFADVFTPDAWLDGRADTQAFMPFSGGPAVCPGQNFALFVATTALANLLRGNTFELDPRTGLTADAAVPATLNHYSLRFRTKPARRR
ncbi:cytochrome P450 [Rhodococcus qingshengii]|uniref:cytochrome P450 n=1 Tax=Rhodococcus qingshengii TaxID=334542 RepID=UPI001C8B8EA7|nr:cytochrome P450 [Rhodococcus qingshengii]MBX9152061.1 cytochrome P450 [Rhodococcus qingshengii]